MSWLSSLSNPFKSESEQKQQEEEDYSDEEQEESPSSAGTGVKENLSEIGNLIGRQLWGVASFLAPPPVSSSPTTTASTSDSTTDSSSQTLVGIRNDFAEFSGSLKSGLSLLSTTKAVNEISKLATNLLQFPREDDDEEEEDELPEGIVGVNEEILEFVRVMSSRPECWTDFPLSLDQNDFDMSDAQKEHSSNMEQLTPSLANLRLKLCPSSMSEGRFWMIYFIMLHPRLNESDAMLLSTPQIVEARDVLLQNIQNKTNTASQSSASKADDVELSNSSNIREEYNSVQQKEVLSETVNPTRQENVDEQENVDQWLEEEDVETGTSVDSRKQLGNDEDVSFSDLEDDDDDTSTTPARSSQVRIASHHGSNEWIQLSENSDNGASRKTGVRPTSREKDSEGEESNDWLTIDDFDEDSVGNA